MLTSSALPRGDAPHPSLLTRPQGTWSSRRLVSGEAPHARPCFQRRPLQPSIAAPADETVIPAPLHDHPPPLCATAGPTSSTSPLLHLSTSPLLHLPIYRCLCIPASPCPHRAPAAPLHLPAVSPSITPFVYCTVAPAYEHARDQWWVCNPHQRSPVADRGN
jgi:hypothetical protein